MNEKIIYIGLDVDDQNFHGTAYNPPTGEIRDVPSIRHDYLPEAKQYKLPI